MKTNLTYTNINGINYPNLKLPEQKTATIGKYGHLWLDYLKKHRRGTYTTLLTTCKLNEHLAEVDAEASQCVRELTEAFAKTEGIAEQLKATNNLLWAKEMNNCKARAEEIVLREVVYR
jgi:hypothetical protein